MKSTPLNRIATPALLALAMAAAVPIAAQAAPACPGEKPESIVVNASGGSMAKSMREAFSADFE